MIKIASKLKVFVHIIYVYRLCVLCIFITNAYKYIFKKYLHVFAYSLYIYIHVIYIIYKYI